MWLELESMLNLWINLTVKGTPGIILEERFWVPVYNLRIIDREVMIRSFIAIDDRQLVYYELNSEGT